MCTSARNVIIPPPHPPQTSCKAFNMCTNARNVIIPPPHPPHPQPKKPKNLRGRSGTRQQKLGSTKQVTRGGVRLDPHLPCWALRQLMARPVPLKDHTTHVFMLYQLYYHEFLVGRLKWTIRYTMMLMMDVGSISSMISSWVAWWAFYPHLPKEKGGILNSKRNLPPKRNTTAISPISPISTWKCRGFLSFLDVSTQKNHATRPPKKTENWICSGTLDMPPYSDFETCRHKMTQMLRLGRAHFDEGAGQLSIVGAIWREGLSMYIVVSKVFF